MKKTKEKEKNTWKAAAWDMLYLTVCSINGEIPKYERVAEMDLQKVYALSKSQSLEAMTFMALERLLKGNDAVRSLDTEQVLTKWEEAKNKAIRKTILMNAERKQLFDFLERQNIWHLPLKGVILCPMYPELGMRQMSDNDVLFDPSFRPMVRSWFESRGYMVESYGKGNHDEYHKRPVYNFEMHTALFSEEAYTEFFQYYASVKNRLHPVAGGEFEYAMSDEDFYVYMVVHMYKHYFGYGTGLRSLLDLYVYHRAKPDLDRRYLDGEFEKIGILDFEKEMRALALKTFADQPEPIAFTENEQKILYELMSNHTYGTIENVWRMQVKKTQPEGASITPVVKMKYFLTRLFPNKEHMEKWCEMYAPFFFRNKWLMPIAYIWRIVKADSEKNKRVKKEFDTVKKM